MAKDEDERTLEELQRAKLKLELAECLGRQAGIALSGENPYDEGTDLHQAWNAGRIMGTKKGMSFG